MKTIKKLAVFALLLIGSKVSADNGALAYAYPIAHVLIDGDLSDWPSDLTRYPIAIIHERGSKPMSKIDFDAFFMVGYNLENNSIYIAIEVQDESHVVDRSVKPEWSNQDKHLLYLDPKHSKRGSCPIAYSATQIRREIGGSEFGWDPQTEHARWDNIELQISRKEDKTIYEYRIELESLSANTVIGLDHVFYDKDQSAPDEKYSYMMWGNKAGKSGAPRRTGDLVLIEDKVVLATVKGNVFFDTLGALNGKQIRINAVNNPTFWITATIDSLGNYTAKLPFGNYYLDFPEAFIGEEEQRIDQSRKQTFSVLKTTQAIEDFYLQLMPKPRLNKQNGVLHNFSANDISTIDAYMKQMMDYYAIPGASLGLIVDGELSYHKTYGVKNALTLEPIDGNTIFQAASITKPVFAYTVLKLSDKGLIDLDKPLHEYLKFDELEKDERYKKMTARHVLSHQTGFPNWGIELNFEPGTSYGYSGEGFEYLKRVVEQITKKSVVDILEEEVLIPFNMMEHTYFVREPEMYAKVALGHTYNMPRNNWIINEVGMARSMYTEANEFTKFILALMNGEGLLETTYTDMLKAQVSIPRNDNNPVADWNRSFGLGLLIKESPYGKCYGHGGSNAYFQSLFEYYPDKKIGFAVFCNNDMGYHLGNDLREFLIIGK